MKDWAEPYELWECKLAILATAGHPDPLLIQSIWTNIIDRSVDNFFSGNTIKDSNLNSLGNLGNAFLPVPPQQENINFYLIGKMLQFISSCFLLQSFHFLEYCYYFPRERMNYIDRSIKILKKSFKTFFKGSLAVMGLQDFKPRKQRLGNMLFTGIRL